MSEPVSFNARQMATPGGSGFDTPTPEASGPKYYRPEKRFPCIWPAGCDHPPFTCPHNVRQHIREAHTKERPYKCEYCNADGKDKGFSRQATLNRHIRDVHKLPCDGRKGRTSKKDVGPTNTPRPVRPTSKGNRAARPDTSYPPPQTPTPTLSNMAAQTYSMESFNSPSAVAMADEWVTKSGHAFPLGMFPPEPPVSLHQNPPGPVKGRCLECFGSPKFPNLKAHFDAMHTCSQCFGRPHIKDMAAHIALVHSTFLPFDATLQDLASLTADEFMAPLGQTAQRSCVYNPAGIQQPSPQPSISHFDGDAGMGADTIAGAGEEYGSMDPLPFDDCGLNDLDDENSPLADFGAMNEDMDYKWQLSGFS